ncbi:ATP-grasp domain-containing protein [Cutibacterium acnes]|uniref:ATP-grasp domain-containing protein n=1 Tax=Cutibacterium acnes TaxID=1747 RepID=UPI000C1F2187|nr:ATP-grasp domain-containing protein [Cutibacterium acnes]PIS93094.1 biotin carboxylase [Cutibacterium acnes]
MFSRDSVVAERKWAVLVGVTTSGSHASTHWFKSFYEACQKRHIMICGVDFEEELKNKIPPISVDCLIRISGPYRRSLDADEIAKIVTEIETRCPGRVALSTALRENYQLQNSLLAEAIGVARNTADCIERIQDKPACRDALRKAGIYQPQSLRIVGVTSDGCLQFSDASSAVVEKPTDSPRGWIVKPSIGMGSVGVRHILNVEDTSGLDAVVLEGGYCLEEFITGIEYSVEGIAIDGRVYIYTTTAKTTNEDFVEIGHIQPADLNSISSKRELEEQLQSCVNALGIECGNLHVEFWVTPEKKIVWGEFHVRQGGDFIAPDLVSAVRPGIDYYGNLIDSLCGLPLHPLPEITQCAASKFIEASPGVVSEVSLYGSVPEEIDLYWECVPGEVAHAVNGSHARVAAIVARGNDEHTVTQLLDRAANACVVRVAPVSRD